MIQTFRTYIKSGKYNVIIWLLFIALMLPMVVPVVTQLIYRFGPQSSQQGIATVNGRAIPQDEFLRHYSAYLNMMYAFKQQYGNYADDLLKQMGMENPSDVQKQLIDSQVKREAIFSTVQPLTLAISDKVVDTYLKDQFFTQSYLSDPVPPAVYQKGVLNHDMLDDYLQRIGLDQDAFTTAVKQGIALSFINDITQIATYVPEQELRKKYLVDEARKKYHLVSVPLQKFHTQAASRKVSEEELRAFYTKHGEQFRVPEKRSGELWRFTPDTYGITASSEDELKKLYHKQKHRFIKTPEQRTVKHILIKINPEDGLTGETKAHESAQQIADTLYQSPEQFDELAELHSDSPDKAKEITTSRDARDPVFERAAFALGQDDAISPVLKTTQGFEIIKFISRKDAEYMPFESARKTLSEEQIQSLFDKRFQADAKRIILQIKDRPELLDEFLKSAKSELLEPQIQGKAPETDVLFDLKEGGFGSTLLNGTGSLIKLTKIEESYLPPFESVRKEVRDAWNTHQAKVLAAEALEEQKTKNPAERDAWAKTVNGTIIETDWTNQNGRYTLAKEQNIPYADIVGLEQVGQSHVHITTMHALLIQLTDVEPIDAQKFEQKRSTLHAQLINQRHGLLSAIFAKSVVDAASITVNEPLVKQLARIAGSHVV